MEHETEIDVNTSKPALLGCSVIPSKVQAVLHPWKRSIKASHHQYRAIRVEMPSLRWRRCHTTCQLHSIISWTAIAVAETYCNAAGICSAQRNCDRCWWVWSWRR